MKFLLDENLSPVLRDLLVESGLDVIHVRDLQMSGSKDEEVVIQAANLARYARNPARSIETGWGAAAVKPFGAQSKVA